MARQRCTRPSRAMESCRRVHDAYKSFLAGKCLPLGRRERCVRARIASRGCRRPRASSEGILSVPLIFSPLSPRVCWRREAWIFLRRLVRREGRTLVIGEYAPFWLSSNRHHCDHRPRSISWFLSGSPKLIFRTRSSIDAVATAILNVLELAQGRDQSWHPRSDRDD